jgi:protoporphyrinogen oxidase
VTHSVGIVGGGILGLTAAYRLAQKGVRVSLFERSPDLGGLVGSFDFNGRSVDRFYHVILPTDDRVRGLAEELGLDEHFRFRPVGVGFYDKGRLFSMSSLREFLTFPMLPFHDRLRLGAFVARCQTIKSSEALDDLPLEAWLRRLSGKRALERLWRPLLDSKFDSRFADLPATYIWARTRRMSATRDSAGREVMGWLEGGYQTLIDTLERRLRAMGAEIHAASAVERIVGDEGGARGIVVDGHFRPFDTVLCTLVPPQARKLLAPPLDALAPEDHCRYLGVVCVVLRTTRSVSPYYTLNITDRRVPLTTVVETTHVVDPEHVGGTLLYATKYVDPSHPVFDQPADAVEAEYLGHVRTIFPDLRDDEILGAVVQRARIVEPVHLVGGVARLPDPFAVPGLVLVSTAHVYPEIVNGQAVIGVADRAVAGIVARAGATREAVAA